ncbi:hypothetical protein HPB48_015426 [Haemaphysalis longicornis]|uniref:Uncharacterized protein n=1 Tax=Haemaphysalis longicornis TaxID=44386 RepID=A0A9J6FPG8_HAELO|nr:hypothetical protein HPB48_015426 [Haemaphysalis longicornis]
MDVAAKDMLDQFEFKNRIAETLLRTHVKKIPEVADEAELEVENGESVAVPKRTKVTAIPPNEVRLDMHGHFPEHVPLKSQMRCRNQGCSGKTRIRCTKCDLFLAFSTETALLIFTQLRTDVPKWVPPFPSQKLQFSVPVLPRSVYYL